MSLRSDGSAAALHLLSHGSWSVVACCIALHASFAACLRSLIPSHPIPFHSMLERCSTFYSPDNELLSSRSKLYLLWFSLIGLLMFLS